MRQVQSVAIPVWLLGLLLHDVFVADRSIVFVVAVETGRHREQVFDGKRPFAFNEVGGKVPPFMRG